ncbi:MAG: error-prone DNA polymerase [Candidatus Palauibacterales bacterium]|nr:error-prone DNA polymerase [Candidatus Palauibacterales bacterium]MDP2483247.1 error-prone DNA polymerase [Candidatus Palauibacterales bacterium]
METNDDFVELAARSAFSLLSGASNPEDLAERATAVGAPALALADVFDLGGAVRFTRACDDAGVRPIIGGEVRLGDGKRAVDGRVGDGRLRLVLLCESLEGYHALSALITRARLSSPRGSPGLVFTEIEGRTDGLTCLIMTENQLPGTPGFAYRAEQLTALFPGRLHLALEHHGLPADARRCAAWMRRARDLGLPWLPVNAPLYARPRDRIVLDVMTCLRFGTTLDEANDRLPPNGEWYLKGAAHMRERWGRKALLETVRVAERCRFHMTDLKPRLPPFDVPGGGDRHAFLRGLVEQGANERYGDHLDARHLRQIEHELRIISHLDLDDYFLIMWDIVRFANRRGILVQGRGSAANSAVCYCLGITAVDPIGLDLLFERFLSESRHEPPDIDLDIAHRDREEVLQYVYQKYGRRHAAMVCESITYRGKMATRDAARTLGLSSDQSDRLSLEVDRGGAVDAARRLAEGGAARAGLDADDPRTMALIRTVAGLEDLPRHRSIHVGGFVISDRPIGEIVPVERATMADRTVIQWDKDDLDLPGFIKFDLLGLGMLTLLGDAIRAIRRTRGVSVDLATLPPDDPAVYDTICAADTVGVFQIESRAQMNTLPRVRPRCFYDLVVEVALIRPGPIQGDMVHPYLRRRNGEEPVTYLDPRLEPLLKRTLGVPLFQEQGMKVAITLAGFSPGQADNMRRAMGFKRSHRKMQEVERDLVEGLRRNGVAPDVADQILKYLTAFANYGFPESHSASFALLVYASAYLKHYYAPEFYVSLLNAQPMGFYSPSTIINDARRHGVEVRPVDLAHSDWDSTLEVGHSSSRAGPRSEALRPVRMAVSTRQSRAGGLCSRSEPPQRSEDQFAEGAQPPVPALRIGLRLVHGLGPKAREKLQTAREKGPFRNVEDVMRRSGLGPPDLRVLAEAGAFETLWPGRRQALWELLRQARGDAGPLARRPRESTAPVREMSALERVAADYRCVGLSSSGHPIEFLRPDLERQGVLTAAGLRSRRTGEEVRVAGLAICRQRPGTAKGVMFVTLEDETGFSNFVVMPDVREEMRDALRAPLLLMEGVVENEQGVVNVRARRALRLDLHGDLGPSRSRDYR